MLSFKRDNQQENTGLKGDSSKYVSTRQGLGFSICLCQELTFSSGLRLHEAGSNLNGEICVDWSLLLPELHFKGQMLLFAASLKQHCRGTAQLPVYICVSHSRTWFNKYWNLKSKTWLQVKNSMMGLFAAA